ncbi:MAG: TetR/AcrR family transcriptional regulator [Rhodospirillales bacterium]
MAAPAGKRPSPARDRLLAAAQARFNAGGYNGTGIDAIIADAGIARMTLYNHFPSKDALIEAVLQRRHEELTDWITRQVEARASAPADRLLAIFDVLGDWLASEDFRGCLFVRAVGELGISHAAVCRAASDHKDWYRRFFRENARNAGVAGADRLAGDLLLLLEGATARALVDGGGRSEAERAKRIARLLVGSG